MASQHSGSLLSHRIPDVAVEVIVSGEQQATRLGERDTRDSANDVVVRVHGELLIGTDIEQPAGGIVGSGGESVSRWEESDGIDIGFVSWEGLLAHAITDIPQLRRSITSSRDECAEVWGEGEGHDVSSVSSECSALLAGLDIPEGAGHISGGSDDLVIIKEPTAREVSSMSWEFARHPHVSFARLQRVD